MAFRKRLYYVLDKYWILGLDLMNTSLISTGRNKFLRRHGSVREEMKKNYMYTGKDAKEAVT